MIIKSPYGFSYYNAPVGWDYKAPDSLRIADHWNFYSKGNTHCKTTMLTPDNTHYTIARYDADKQMYEPIECYVKLKTSVKDTLDYKLLFMDAKRNKAIKCLTKELSHNANINQYLNRLELTHAEKMVELLETIIK
jgi:hypothetical protein